MIAVALKGLAGRKVRAAAHRARRRHRRRDGQRHLHPHRHDAEVVQRPLHRVDRQDRRRHQRQGDRQELHQRQRDHDPRIDARQGPGAARGRGGRRRGQPAGGQRRRHHRPRRQGRRQGERRRQLRRRQRALQPVQAQDRQGPARARRGRDRRRHRRRRSTTRSATRSSSRPLGKKHTYRVSGTVSFGSVDSLGFASIAAWDVKTAQTLLDREGRYDAISVAAKNGTSSRRSSCGRSSRSCRPTCEVKDASASRPRTTRRTSTTA